MRKSITLLSLFSAFLFMISCGGDDDPAATHPLVGTWVHESTQTVCPEDPQSNSTDENLGYTVTFNADGKYIVVNPERTLAGSWQAMGSSVTVIPDDPDLETGNAEFFINGNTLTIISGDDGGRTSNNTRCTTTEIYMRQ